MVLVVVLGLTAAFLLALSASLQQYAARRAARSAASPGSPPRGIVKALPLLRVLRRLVRSPAWVLGQATNVAGVVVQGAALHLGSIAVVQPLIATQLLFALPLGARRSHRRLRLTDWLSAAAIVGAIVLFLAVRGTAPLSGRADRPRIILAGLCVLTLAGLIVTVAAGRRPRVYATLLAVAGGMCSAMSAVLIKLTAADLVDRGVARTAADWPGYALALSTLCALLLGQQAFASGSLAAAVAAGSATNPVASYLMGILVFHAEPPHGAGPWAALAGTGALLLAGTVGLAHSPAVAQDEPDTPDEPSEPDARTGPQGRPEPAGRTEPDAGVRLPGPRRPEDPPADGSPASPRAGSASAGSY
jgi:drug/metabolite transporter (DMT)-like permease